MIKLKDFFCIYSCPLKGYVLKWHNLTSSRSQISILRVRGPKWHLETSSRAAGVFNSRKNLFYMPPKIAVCMGEVTLVYAKNFFKHL